MLSIIILTFLITSNVIPRIQGEKQEEQKAVFSGTQTPVYKNGSGGGLIEALNVQKRDTLNIVAESYVKQTNHVDKSQSGNRLRRDLNLNNVMPDVKEMLSPVNNRWKKTGPNIFYGSQTYQRNNVYVNDGGNVIYGSQDVQIGNTYPDNPNGTNVYGSIIIQENNTYRGRKGNAQYGAKVTQIGNKYPDHPGKNDIYAGIVIQNNNTYEENPGLAIEIHQSNNIYPKSIEGNKDALKPVIHRSGNIYPSSNDLEARINTKNNAESLLSTNYDAHSSSQMSLSSNVFHSVLCSLLILLNHSIFSY